MNSYEAERLAWHHLAQAQREQQAGRPGYALGQARHSVALLPTVEGYLLLGSLFRGIGQYEEAIQQCQNAIALDPDRSEPYIEIGLALIALERWHEAQPWLEMALNTPHCARPHTVHLHLGRTYEQLGRWHEARARYRRALALEPTFDEATAALHALTARLG